MIRRKVDKEKFMSFFFVNSCPKTLLIDVNNDLRFLNFLLFSFLSKKREENLNDKEKNVVACKKVDKEIPNSCPKKPLIDVNNDLQFFPALKRFLFFVSLIFSKAVKNF